jgi:hypothetical protein
LSPLCDQERTSARALSRMFKEVKLNRGSPDDLGERVWLMKR